MNQLTHSCELCVLHARLVENSVDKKTFSSINCRIVYIYKKIRSLKREVINSSLKREATVDGKKKEITFLR